MQAEDGIRDLVRSRGLGDVYKRQDYDQAVRVNDTEAADFIKSISGVGSPTEVQGFDKGKRNEIIKACKEKGLSFRQIERLTGVSFGVIRSV